MQLAFVQFQKQNSPKIGVTQIFIDLFVFWIHFYYKIIESNIGFFLIVKNKNRTEFSKFGWYNFVVAYVVHLLYIVLS